MAWIESHQALGRHPKTLRLAAELRCTLPTAVGYLQFLWWWALDYAQDGVVEADARVIVGRACEWRGPPERFWAALITAGFVDPLPGGGVRVHDWAEYAGRLIDKRKKDAERKRLDRTSAPNPPDVGRTSGSESAGGPAYQPTNQPDQPPVGPLSTSSPARARAANGALPRRAPGQDEPPPLRPGQQQCPLCPEVFPDNPSVRLHLDTSPRHKVRPAPDDLHARPASTNAPPPTVSEAAITAELAAMAERKPLAAADLPPELVAEHERFLAAERARRETPG